MFGFSVFNFLASMRNRQQFVRPAAESISPIVDIAMQVNKIKRDDLQPLGELSTRMVRAFEEIKKLEISRYRAVVAMRLELLDLKDDKRLLMKLANIPPPVSRTTQTLIFKQKPCRVRFTLPTPEKLELEPKKATWLNPSIITPYFKITWFILQIILNHLKNPVILRKIAKRIYYGFGKLIRVTTTIDIPNNTTTIDFRGFPRNSR